LKVDKAENVEVYTADIPNINGAGTGTINGSYNEFNLCGKLLFCT